MTRILFVCGKGRMRSPTAAEVAGRIEGVQADFAGLSADADERVSPEQIAWADVIAVMERRQLARLKRLVGSVPGGKRLVCLDIPDTYQFMQPELVDLLAVKLRRVL